MSRSSSVATTSDRASSSSTGSSSSTIFITIDPNLLSSSSSALVTSTGASPTVITTTAQAASSTTPISFTLSQIATPPGEWRGIAASATGQYIAIQGIGSRNRIFIFTNNGASNREVTILSSRSSTWTDVTSSSSGRYLAACYRSSFIYTSSDYGDTWTRAILSSGAWVPITSSISGQYLATCEVVLGHVSTSSNYGASWTQVSTQMGTCGYIKSSASGRYLIAGGEYRIPGLAQRIARPYISSDYGANWTQSTLPQGGRWGAVACSSSGQYMAASHDNGNLYVSSNYGANWTQNSLPSGECTSLTFSDSGQYMGATLASGDLYFSSDYGANWRRLSQSAWREVTFAPNGTQLVVAGNNSIATS